MIANSHPYNPSQLSQQQRCVGIDQQQNHTNNNNQLMNRITQNLPNISQQQQNSLYGSTITQNNTVSMPPQPQANNNMHRPSHMFDLANLHQNQQPGSLFDSAYDDATSSLATINQLGSDQNNHNIMGAADLTRSQLQHQQTSTTGNKNHQQQQNDISLYSPSSSTSLLYHVYDQINLPTDQAQMNHNNFKRSNTTTLLNPASLFGSTMVTTNNNGNGQHQQLALPHHQNTLASQQEQHNNFGQAKTTTIPQQELYSSGAQFHLHQPPFNAMHPSQQNNHVLDNHQMMLDTILRQQHAATTRAQNYHNRPLSSSGASSMSGQSMALTYGRQPRKVGQLPPLPPINSGNKSLASVLHSNQTLNLSLVNGHLTPTLDTRGPKKLNYPSATSGSSGAINLTTRKWKRVQQRVRHMAYEYSTLLKCSILLILLATFSMSIIKFASKSSTSSTNIPFATNQNQNFMLQAHSIQSSSQSSNIAQGNMYPLIYPPSRLPEQQTPVGPANDVMDQSNVFGSATGQMSAGSSSAPDVLKSKLLIGEFVITSQNYSNSAAQKSLLAENIVKLMDQVFLSTEVRRAYSRMEITNIRPFRPSGIVVDCNIILSESITYAAQQFGKALYDSLVISGEKLANQPSFIIDKNSIRFNTVPDKDLAIVPPELIPSTFPRAELAAAAAIGQAPSRHSQLYDQANPNQMQTNNPMTRDDQSQSGSSGELENAVVWSEWSQWSSCVDKNGICDAGRLHSRLRKCVAQHTGEKVDALQCRQRFNMQDQELEVADCSQSCSNNNPNGADPHVMSDAPSLILPQTAPSVMMAGVGGLDSPAPFLLANSLGNRLSTQTNKPNKLGQMDSLASSAGALGSNQADLFGSSVASTSLSSNIQPASTSSSVVAQSTQVGLNNGDNGGSSTTERAKALAATEQGPILMAAPQLDQQQQQMSCSNCTSDEICLLLVQQKVPFCAKVKDRQDESGCGGWCKAQSQLCQPVGANAFKCIHDSECLHDEWRCHDSACIPLSKRCDGHSNCYDNSDERDCPNR